MPSFSTESSVVRVASDHFTLCLKSRHRLDIGSPSQVHTIKTRFPEEIDVFLASDLVVTLYGAVDRVKVANQDVLISAVAGHLVRYLEANATEVGLDAISNIYIDEDDGLPKFTLTSSRRLTDASRTPHATLISIDLRYIWKTTSCNHGIESHPFVDDMRPFSSQLLLPVESVLNEAVEKFVALHLIKRYPLIFGPWCKKLDVEATFFSPIFHSIFNVIKHSSNTPFRKNCKRLLKTIVRQHSRASSKALSALASITDDSTVLSETGSDEETMTDEKAFHLSMERLYRTRIRNPIFKMQGTDPIDCDTEDELNSSSHVQEGPSFEQIDMDTALEEDEDIDDIDMHLLGGVDMFDVLLDFEDEDVAVLTSDYESDFEFMTSHQV